MFEKFSAFDIDSAGRGGEYTVQVSCASLRCRDEMSTLLKFLLYFVGWIWLDQWCSSLDCELLRLCDPSTGVPNFNDCCYFSHCEPSICCRDHCSSFSCCYLCHLCDSCILLKHSRVVSTTIHWIEPFMSCPCCFNCSHSNFYRTRVSRLVWLWERCTCNLPLDYF